MSNKHIKRCSRAYAIREMQIKIRYYYAPVRTAKIQNTDNTKYWPGCGAAGALVASGNENGTATEKYSSAVSHKTKHTVVV